MGLTTTEVAVLLRSDGGKQNRVIARELKLSPRYVETIVSRYAVSLAADASREDRIRNGTRLLGEAVVAAGGHR